MMRSVQPIMPEYTLGKVIPCSTGSTDKNTLMGRSWKRELSCHFSTALLTAPLHYILSACCNKRTIKTTFLDTGPKTLLWLFLLLFLSVV